MIGKRPLEDHEVQQLLQEGFKGYYKTRNKALFALGISTGFRAGEMLALQMRQVMHRKNVRKYVKLQKHQAKGQTQGRTMKVYPFAQAALQAWIDQRLQAEPDLPTLLDQPVFISREKDTRTGEAKPITITQCWQILDQAFRRCDIVDNVGTHSMRKTFAQKAYQDAVKKFKADKIVMEPLRVVQKQLGHKTIQSTLSYLSFIGSDVEPSLFDFTEF